MARYDSQLPAPSAPKGNSKFEILLVKMLSLKKQNQILPTTIEKSNFYFPRKPWSLVFLDKRLQWVNVKQKPFRQI